MKEPINIGALDPQQRLDVASGQPAPSVAGMDGWREAVCMAIDLIQDLRRGTAVERRLRELLSVAPVPPVQVDEREAFERDFCVSEKSIYWSGEHQSYRSMNGGRALEADDAEEATLQWCGFQAGAAWQRTQASPAIPDDWDRGEVADLLAMLSSAGTSAFLAGDEVSAEQAAYVQALSRQAMASAHSLITAILAADAPSADGGKVESDEVRRDAERYRHLVSSGHFTPSSFGNRWALRMAGDAASKAELDAVVDAALSAQHGEGERG